MSMTRACLISFAMLAFAAMGFQAPAPMTSPTDPNDPGSSDEALAGRVNLGGNGGYFRANYVAGNGVGWDDGGFTTLGGWLPFNEFGSDTLWYSDLRVFITNDSNVGGNAGIGVRRYNENWDRFFGGTVFYDWDHGAQNNSFGQITTSLETIGDIFDGRFNLYLPVSNATRDLGASSISPNPFFKNNRIFFPGTGLFLEALQGGDAEVGVPLVRDQRWLRGYVGYYAYNSNSHKDVEGFRGRLEAQLSDDLSVQGMVTDDRTFGTLVNLIVDVRLGGGRPIRAFPSLTSRERMYLPVQRNWRISTNTYKQKIDVVARDPGDHHKLEVAWVDNSAPGGGDGTFEHPFQNLPDAQTVPTADFVLVRHGTGATYDGGIDLNDNQRLLGEGRAHQFDAFAQAGNVKVQGTFTLPGFTNDPSLYPTITNTLGSAVQLANNNEVSAFNIDSPASYGITGTGITDFNLNHLNIFGAGLGGINLNNASGNGTINNATLDNNLGAAILVSNVNASPLSLDINAISSVTNNVQALSISANNSLIMASVDGYLASANQSGLDLTASNGGVLGAAVSNSTFDGSTGGDGVRLTAVNAGSQLGLDMTNTTASNSSGNGLVVDSSDLAVINASIADGNFDNSGLDGVRVLSNNGSTGNILAMTDTSAANAGVDGLHAEITNVSDFDVHVTNGNFSNAGQDAIDATVDNSSTLNLTIDPTPANLAGANGFRFQVSNNSILNANLADTDLSGAGANGVLGLIDTNSQASLQFTNSAMNNAALTGMSITAQNGSSFLANVVNGNMSFSGQDGINLQLLTGSTGTLNLNGAPASDNGQNGLLFNVQDGSTLTANVAASDFSRSGVNAIQGTVNGVGSSVTLDLDNVTGDNSGLDGFIFRVQNGAQLTATGTDGSFNNSGNHGIRGIIENGSTASIDLDTFSVANSQANGLYITGSGNSTFDGIFTNGSFANSGLNVASPNRNAVEISMDNSVGSLILTDTAGNNNGQNGLLMTAQNNGALNVTVNNGNFNDSPVNAIQSNVSGAGSVNNLTLNNTTGNNSGLDGLRFNVSNSGQFIANMTGGSFNTSGDSGIHGVLDNNATASLTMNNVSVDRSNDDGLLVSSTNGSLFTGIFNGGGFTNAGQDGASLNRNAIELLVNNSTNNLTLTNTAGNNAGADGLHFAVNNGGQLSANVSGGTFANSGSNAVDGFTTGGGTSATVALSGTAADNSGSTGVLLDAEAGSNLAFSFANASISNSGDHGVQLSADGAGTTASLDLTTATINNNGVGSFLARDGLNLNATAGAQVDVNVSQGTIVGNRDDGIRATVNGAGSGINITGSGTSVTGNLRGDGFGFDVSAGGSLAGVFTGGSFSGNGTITAASGVRGNVNGLGSVADVTFNGTAVDNNRADGFTMTSLNTGSLTLRLNNGASASNNLGYGINFTVDGPNTEGNLLMTGNNIISNNGLGGIRFSASNGAQTTSAISGNVSNNGGAGVTYLGNNLTINSLTFTGIFSDNAGQGINVDLNNSTVNALSVQDATVNDNGLQGVRIAAANGSHINNGLITNNTLSGNGGDGLLFSLSNSDATLFAIDSNLEINSNTGNGVHVVLNNAPTTDLSVTNNGGINGNTQNGVVFDLTNSALTDVLVDSNAISGNGAAGLQFNTTTSNVSGAITNNVIDSNLLSGVGISATGGAPITTIDFGNVGLGHIIANNTINGNGNAGVGAGILANLGQNVQFTGTIQHNTISQNQSFGVGITSTDGSVDLTMGGTPAQGNTLDKNVGAGLALTLQNSSTGTVDIQNNTITGTLNGTDPAFLGDGINIRLRSTNILAPSTAQLTASVISNNIIGSATDATKGNAGRGIAISNDGNSLIDNLTLDTNTVGHSGNDGIQINKDGDANITNVAITNSNVTNNAGDGLEISVANGNQTTTFNVANNQFTNNTDNGIHLNVQADSRIDADLTNNTISGNTNDGIHVTEQINDPTDQRDVTGVWIQNRIVNNGGDGIALDGAYGNASPLVIGQTGFDGLGNPKSNLIDNNGGFGIRANSVGNAVITNNTITNNRGGGVQVISQAAFGNEVIVLDQNLIGLNKGDGLELRATGTAFLSITATGNSIVNNTGRGVDSLNQVNATTFLQFGDGTVAGGNIISNNDGEGFYVVNTSSANQTQNVSASTALLADGAVNVAPDMVLDLQFNQITNNGSPGAFPSSGLVLRVGTSNSAGLNLTGDGAAGVGSATLAGNGRVNARVINNTFGGNFGTDVLVESFTSTIDPIKTVGAWDDTTFNVTAMQRDPLARLNMVFRNNTGESLDVTRGESDRNAGDPSTGAFYSNTEDVFKSRLTTQGPISAGPFTNADRRRNAQRLASNNGPYAAPSFPAGAVGFAYDGVGNSTFRVESNFSTAGFTGGDSFAGDFGTVPPVANANGVPFTGALPGQELPFGWDTSVAPGTFQFLIP